jgi:transcription elongation factor GreB
VSKAFTKDDDEAPDPGPVRRRGVPVPEGPNYVTPAGIVRLRAELAALSQAPRDAAGEDRLRELTDHLATAEALEPADKTRVGLGAKVTVEDEHGKRSTYQLVGAIEAAPREGAISWQSPIANALWDAEVGDGVTLPNGHDVEIVAIDYQ